MTTAYENDIFAIIDEDAYDADPYAYEIVSPVNDTDGELVCYLGLKGDAGDAGWYAERIGGFFIPSDIAPDFESGYSVIDVDYDDGSYTIVDSGEAISPVGIDAENIDGLIDISEIADGYVFVPMVA